MAENEAGAVEQEPAVAAQLFGEGIEQARGYAVNLLRHGEELGLLGPSEYARLWTRHLLNSVLPAPLLEQSVADVGSGAGLPGLPLAIARPDVEFTLIEPMERRVRWLEQQVVDLGLPNVTVIRSRAEDLADEVAVRQVTARAVSALAKLIPVTVPLLLDGGELLLIKGQSAEQEIDRARKAIQRYRLGEVRVEVLGEGLVAEPTRVVRARVGA